jgi:cytochrome c556
MFPRLKIMSATAVCVALASAAFAASHIDPGIAGAIKVRHAHMQLYAFNLGPLGAMAQDKMPYDAAVAETAARNLAAVASLNQTGYWIAGSDNSVEGSRAKPEIFTDMAGFESKMNDLTTATAALAEVAGTDLDAMKAAFGPVGAACGACHKDYRVSDN